MRIPKQEKKKRKYNQESEAELKAKSIMKKPSQKKGTAD